ncbi:hypothetical protein V6N11_062678 [Hibiscus sabdariffa]|uniref:Uncharacterized protein n=1 Tax=Hibiscus sabdariffa TaxID=183260 RepID=A0ABR2PTB7_9ROSI
MHASCARIKKSCGSGHLHPGPEPIFDRCSHFHSFHVFCGILTLSAKKRATEEQVEAETEPGNGESRQGPVGRQRRHGIRPSKLVVPNKLKKGS